MNPYQCPSGKSVYAVPYEVSSGLGSKWYAFACGQKLVRTAALIFMLIGLGMSRVSRKSIHTNIHPVPCKWDYSQTEMSRQILKRWTDCLCQHLCLAGPDHDLRCIPSYQIMFFSKFPRSLPQLLINSFTYPVGDCIWPASHGS